MPEAKELTYIEAVNAALFRCLEEFPEALVYGEDVGKPGGVFGATKGLKNKFGKRVFDTPISESAILGSAVGAAMFGMRPVVEVMWIDFTLVALDQIVNQAANVRYVSNGRLSAPLTVRTQQGVLPGSCAQHSQSLEAIFAHIPGLLVGLPSNPQDAYGMLLAAVATDDPAIVIEHRSLYFGDTGEVVLGGEFEAVGGARVLREGSDATILSWGAAVNRALEAAAILEREGVEVEVIDARWLAPFDTEAVVDSVEKTSYLLVVQEANVTGGFGAEVAARVSEQALHALDAPVRRVGVPDCRMPAAPVLQQALLPGAEAIARELRATVA